MDYIQIIVIIVLIIVVSQIVSNINANKRLKARLINSFGKIPDERRHDFNSIETYYAHKKAYGEDSDTVDNITWNDLDMNLIFKRINSCHTSVGEEYLYDTLRNIQADDSILLKREKLISYLEAHPGERLRLQMSLSKAGRYNYNGIVPLIFDSESKALKYSFLYKILSLLPIIGIIALFRDIQVGTSMLIFSIIINVFTYYKTKGDISVELSAIKYFSSLLACLNDIFKKKSYDSIPFFDELEENYNVFKKLRTKLSGLIYKDNSDMGIIAEYINIVFLVDIRNYNKIVKTIIGNTEEFHALYKSLGEIDMATCVLSFRKSLPISCSPGFNHENSIDYKEMYHPLLTNPVPNSGVISNDSIVTGSNASGKSTFIKGLAVNGILAQTIHTCAAAEFKIRPSVIITSMAIRDNISEGDSYFIKEIESLKRILDKVEETTCMCFIDEILRGTNTIERIAASSAVLKYLHDKDCICITASHDIELTQILDKKYNNYHFREEITDDGITFDYELKDGPSKTRNAIKLLEYMEFDDALVEEAQILANDFSINKAWPVIS